MSYFSVQKVELHRWTVLKALKCLHFFAAVSLHMLKNLRFADLSTVLQQNNEPK